MLMFRFLFMYMLIVILILKSVFFFFFLSNWDGSPQGVGAPMQMHTCLTTYSFCDCTKLVLGDPCYFISDEICLSVNVSHYCN